MQLKKYKNIIIENEIDGESLIQITKDDLKNDLGITKFIDRKAMVIGIQRLKNVQKN